MGDICVPDNCQLIIDLTNVFLLFSSVLFLQLCFHLFTTCLSFGSATASTWDTLSLFGVGSGGFGDETTVVYIPLIWDTALSEILDEGDSESEADQEAGSSEEDEEDDEEEDEDGKCVTGTFLVIHWL